MDTENQNNIRKSAAEMTIEELQIELAELNHQVLYETIPNKHDKTKPKFRGSGVSMRRPSAYGNTFNGGRK